jgi:hypothetical protein
VSRGIFYLVPGKRGFVDNEDLKLVAAIIAGIVLACIGATIFIVFVTLFAEWYLNV